MKRYTSAIFISNIIFIQLMIQMKKEALGAYQLDMETVPSMPMENGKRKKRKP